ncbi:formate dehydrogenase subunit alpha [Candidatus Acetothermia bacterium]|nr:formate dehydrogenase subunit alpha [Candidatus Acetothermia bacterium]
MREVKTICPYCGVGCGLILQVENGNLTGLKPEKDHPVSKGTLCPKGATAHEFVQHPDRLKKPLLRKNEKLVEVSWDEAYSFVVSEFRRLQSQFSKDSVAVISSTRATVEENYLTQKFTRAVLGTNNIDQCQRICHSATVTGLSAVMGTGAMSNSIAEFLTPGPKVLMIIGSNTAGSHPIVWSVWMKPALRNGTKLIVIDPRRTEVVKEAERMGLPVLHLALKPGSEVPLFNAMAHHIVSQGLHDKKFISERCENFDQFNQTISKYTPENVEKVTGVPATKIREAAELYASAKPASIAYGIGVTEHRNGVGNVKALANLAMITGNMGIESGGLNALRGQNDVQGATDMVRPETLPGYQKWSDTEAIKKFEQAWRTPLPIPTSENYFFMSQFWDAATQGRLKGLYCMGEDVALSEGNSAKVEKALQRLELLIVQDIFLTKTAQWAHVVLPAASFAEKDGTFVNSERRVQRVRKAIEPVGESKPDWVILCELSQRMGYPMYYASAEEIFEEIRKLVPIYGGMTYQRLEESHGLQWPCPDEKHPGTKYLHKDKFSRGRGQLSAVDYIAPAEEPDENYPFILTSGRSFMQYNAGSMTRRTKAGKAEPENYVQVNTSDAARLGIKEGELVKVATRRGELAVKAKITDIAEGVLWMPMHYSESSTNILTIDAVDPISGITEVKACAATLQRI